MIVQVTSFFVYESLWKGTRMEEFIKELTQEIRSNLAEEKEEREWDIETFEVTKVNDITLSALLLKQGGKQISRTFYMEPYFDKYLKGSNLRDLANEIIELTLKEIGEEICDVALGLEDYEQNRRNICIQLLSKELNEEYLKDKLYIPIEDTDLVGVFYVLMCVGEYGNSTVVVTKSLASLWGVESAEELFNEALENSMRKCPAQVINMKTIIEDILGELNEFECTEGIRTVEELFVLTNEIKFHGAAVLLYTDVLKNFAKELEVTRVVVLPSSRHETIIVPYDETYDLNSFESMVKEINQAEVSGTDILSNHIYIYEVDEDRLHMWAKEEE